MNISSPLRDGAPTRDYHPTTSDAIRNHAMMPWMGIGCNQDKLMAADPRMVGVAAETQEVLRNPANHEKVRN